MKARMPLEPAPYRRGLVGSIIVDDEMQVEIGQSPLAEPVLGARRANAPLPM